ncbi:sensor domain-containing diguanylate cyclase [Pseudidiomarina sediminum]|uniref:sensor domain-containing diguanylate cyclase n=1 Tax=Pseudidiomarina sediminum TaxID=431675 RepID=UPI001C9712FF|nr:sensor domain-containing diguanylate cyclase [Pseudidiomarina sediminum]MBY6064459.1 diguanylate cyclase [Pseudidiomarina sediminum]
MPTSAQNIMQQLPGVTYQLMRDPKGHFYFAFLSQTAADLLGLEVAPLLEDASALLECVHPDDRERVINASILSAEQDLEWHHPFRFIRPDGRQLWLDAYDTGQHYDDGSLSWTGFIVEATHRRQLEQELRASELRFRTLVEQANDIIFTVDSNGIIGYLSPNWERCVEHPVDEALHRSFEEIVHPDDMATCNAFIQSILSGGPSLDEIEFRVKHPDEQWHWYGCRGSRVEGDGNEPGYLMGIAREITEQRQQREKMARMARQDMLTNLPNRVHFDEAFERSLSQCQQQDTALAVLFVDLDDFKPVNDSHGHNIGDQLLIHVARRVKSCLRDSDLACRIGGDEFVVLARDLPSSEVATDVASTIAERIREELEKPFAIEQLTLSISASIGVAIYPFHAQQTGELLRCADQAMYHAKQGNRNCVKLWHRATGELR